MAIFDITYIGDMPYLKTTGGIVTGPTTFGSSITVDEITTGDLITTGNASFTNNIQANTINGVTVGSSPKFTDTITSYSVATTSANGLMAAADKVAVNKIGSGTLNTTNKTIIPAINELKAASGNVKVDYFTITNLPTSSNALTSVGGNFTMTTTSNSNYEYYKFIIDKSGRMTTSSSATFNYTLSLGSAVTHTTPGTVGLVNPTGSQTILGFSDNSRGYQNSGSYQQTLLYPGKTMAWIGTNGSDGTHLYAMYDAPTEKNWVVFTGSYVVDSNLYLLVFYI